MDNNWVAALISTLLFAMGAFVAKVADAVAKWRRTSSEAAQQEARTQGEIAASGYLLAVEKLEARVASLERERSEFTRERSRLIDELAKRDKRIEDLEGEVRELRSEVERLRSRDEQQSE